MILLFFSAMAVALSGAMMPGPMLTYTIKQTLSSGPRSGFIIIAGHILTEVCLLILILLGFDIVLKSDAAQIGIGLAGGFFLIYMGGGMIINSVKNRISIDTETKDLNKKNMFLSGILFSASSPYFLLWWAVIGMGFLMQSYRSHGFLGFFVYFLGHVTTDIIWYGTVSVVVGKTRRFIKEKPYRVVLVLLGIMLIFFGCKFVYEAMVRI